MLRRLHPEQPASFAFTAANMAWAEKQLTRYPEGRQASAIIPLLWRAQEQEGWLSRPAIETVADMLGLAHIRALEVATFYFMFQLAPVGEVHVQVCGTTSCMICGAEDLIAVCRDKIGPKAHEVFHDGRMSWEEVECLGACSNAPMVQIGKDFYEDLTAESFGAILDAFLRGEVPTPGPQNGRYASEPKSGLTSLVLPDDARVPLNASMALAEAQGDTVARITGEGGAAPAPKPVAPVKPAEVAAVAPVVEAPAVEAAAQEAPAGEQPAALEEAREGGADDLKKIKGVGPKMEQLLNSLGIFHFDQVAGWTAAEVAWVDDNLQGFKGRVSRDGWVEQAKLLAAGEDTEFSRRVDDGDVY